MNISVIGSGAREHALAWKLEQEGGHRIEVTPGNGGTGRWPAGQRESELVVIGPEGPLADGLADQLRSEGKRVFGPSREAAEIESSKSFAKQFMERHRVPTARYQLFDDFEEARRALTAVDYPYVLKASGLAAGKGVLLPDTPQEALLWLEETMLQQRFGSAGLTVLLEERLEGPEVSLLAFCDGHSLAAMPTAADHKRLLDGDRGPNTGGMGAIAPVATAPAEWLQTIMQPTLDGLAAEGRPFVGVLYAGLMLTAQGPRVLEFNCRFGDPEAEVLLPLLKTPLSEVLHACSEGRLGELTLQWHARSAACVVVASPGYPENPATGAVIEGLALEVPDTVVFHAGTRCVNENSVTAGGRVLAVTGLAEDRAQALQRAYQRVHQIHFEGMQYRKDIGRNR